MNKWKAVGLIVMVLIVAIAVLVLWFVPIIEVAYTEQEPYTTTETYTEKEPYTATEVYYDQVPYTGTETYYEQVPYTVKEQFQYTVVETGKNNVTTPEPGGCAYVEIKNLDHGAGQGLFGIHFTLQLKGGASWDKSSSKLINGGATETLAVCYTGEPIAEFDYEFINIPEKDVIKYRDVPKTREVLKYREVEREREVTRYRDIEKTREVTRIHDVEKTKKVSMFEYWFD